MSNWRIKELKYNARKNLKNYYWIALVACLIFGMISGFFGVVTNFRSGSNTGYSNIQNEITSDNSNNKESPDPYTFGYGEGYSIGYGSFQNNQEIDVDAFKNYLKQNNIDVDSDYGKGYLDGYKQGYMDAFESKDYDDSPKNDQGESSSESSLDGGKFEEAFESGNVSLILEALKEDFNEIFGTNVRFGYAIFIIILLYFIVSYVYKFLLVNPVNVGLQRFFQNARLGNVQMSAIFSSFRKGKYKSSVRTMVRHDIVILLFLLAGYAVSIILFILSLIAILSTNMTSEAKLAILIAIWIVLFIACLIPFTIKVYQYKLALYIKSENISLNGKETLKLSKEIMKGEKWHFFCLQLSFIGWWILGMLACGIGLIFVMPYYNATVNEFYALMRQKAFAKNICDSSTLMGYDPPMNQQPPFNNGNGGYWNQNQYNNQNYGNNYNNYNNYGNNNPWGNGNQNQNSGNPWDNNNTQN